MGYTLNWYGLFLKIIDPRGRTYELYPIYRTGSDNDTDLKQTAVRRLVADGWPEAGSSEELQFRLEIMGRDSVLSIIGRYPVPDVPKIR